jgi:hypothetical protein
MYEATQVIPATEATAELRRQLGEWFEQEFGSADRWRSADYYVLLNRDAQLAGLSLLKTWSTSFCEPAALRNLGTMRRTSHLR